MSVLSIGLTALCVALLGVSLWLGPRMIRFERRRAREGLIVLGAVIEEIHASEGYTYRVRYEVADRSYELLTSGALDLSIDQLVPVRYLPGKPQHGCHDVSLDRMHNTISFTIFGVIGLVGTVVFILLGLEGVL